MIRTDCGKISDTTTKQKLGRRKTLIWGKLENKTFVISIDVTRETAVYLEKKKGVGTPNISPWKTSSHVTVGEFYVFPVL